MPETHAKQNERRPGHEGINQPGIQGINRGFRDEKSICRKKKPDREKIENGKGRSRGTVSGMWQCGNV